jgi:hypothetical protein
MQVLLDSVILIDHFNNISLATEYLRLVRKESAISVITRLEVLTGFPESEWSEPIGFLNYFPCLPFDTPIADITAQLRQQYKWKTPDAIQAGLAQYHQLKLATRNTKDFSPEKHSFVIIPYHLNA